MAEGWRDESLNSSVYRRIGVCTLILGLAACATERPRYAIALHAPALPQPVASDSLDQAIHLMGQGQAAAAREQLVAILQAHPDDATAKLLVAQIDRNPKAILGEYNHPYRTKPGDTLAELAQRFLGDRHLFYALARYNGIAVPDLPLAGRVLMIPGQAASSSPHPPLRARREHPAAQPAARSTQSIIAAVPPPRTDVAAARQLRGAGLEDLSRGRVDAAIGLLERAQGLDPANALIAQDLGRARRLQLALQARR